MEISILKSEITFCLLCDKTGKRKGFHIFSDDHFLDIKLCEEHFMELKMKMDEFKMNSEADER